MTITRNFKLCLNAGTQNAPYINANQYDEGEQWIFDLYTEGGQKFTPSTGAIIGIKSDGHAILNSGTVNSDGQVVITETQQMTAASGLAVFELLIEGETHGTANFIVNVERRPSDDAEFSDSDLSMLQEAVDAAEVINEILDEGGDPSEIIEENVNAWLDNHPEATTTVEDGAITAPKINNSLWDKLLVSEEASGAVASFEDGADDVPVSSLKVALEPIQTGSGDPSPSNVRPIIAANGKNLLQVTATTQTISGVTFTVENGIITANGTATEALNLFVAQGLSITGGTLSGCPSGGSTSTYYMNGRVNGSWNAKDTGNEATFTGTLDQVAITIASGYTCNNLVFKPMIRLASITDSTFQPYQGIMVERTGENVPPVSYPISLGREVYGGSVDLATGVLTVTHGIVDMGTLTYTYRNSFGMQTNGLSATIKNPSSNNKPVNAISSIAKAGSWTVLVNSGTASGLFGVSGGFLGIATTETNPTTFKTAVTGQTICYELVEPQTINLTPQEVKTLLGHNNISSNGTVDVIYHADTKLYIDKRIAELG